MLIFSILALDKLHFMNKLPILIVILCSSLSFGQASDSTARQVEISGAGYKMWKSLYTQFALGVNFPAKKDNWYNNLALSVNNDDATRSAGVLYSFYSLSVGKSYQHIHKHLFWTAGLNTGLYYAHFSHDNYWTRHYGVALIPKLEIGFNTKKTIISAGYYVAAGVGTFQRFHDGVTDPSYLKIIGAGNLYIKLILK